MIAIRLHLRRHKNTNAKIKKGESAKQVQQNARRNSLYFFSFSKTPDIPCLIHLYMYDIRERENAYRISREVDKKFISTERRKERIRKFCSEFSYAYVCVCMSV